MLLGRATREKGYADNHHDLVHFSNSKQTITHIRLNVHPEGEKIPNPDSKTIDQYIH